MWLVEQLFGLPGLYLKPSSEPLSRVSSRKVSQRHATLKKSAFHRTAPYINYHT
jgi:hypothetical protein